MELKKYCIFSFTLLDAILTHSQVVDYPTTWEDSILALFVTLKNKEELRGCVGTTEPAKVSILLPRYTLMSAFKDTRFKPIEEPELNSLTCSVSILSQIQPCATWNDWEIGKDGIKITFTVNSKRIRQKPNILLHIFLKLLLRGNGITKLQYLC